MARLIDAAWRMFRYIVAVLLFLAVTPVLSSFLPTRLQPRQPSEPDEPTRQTFGIGFDLAVSNGCVDLLLYRSWLISTSLFPTRRQPRQPSEPARQTFGIGFDLAISYGCVDLHFYRSWLISTRTVAVSYPNGTVQSIAKVEGDAAYVETMSRLSLLSSRHLQYASFYSIRWKGSIQNC